MNKLPNNAHLQGGEDADAGDLHALRELLKKEEKKLSVLKTIRGLQETVTTNKASSSIQGSALNKASGRSSGSGSGRNSPNPRASQPKHSIVVVPGNQATPRLATAQGSSTSNTGISSRLQQLVDNIAVDQAISSCNEKLHSSASAKGNSRKLTVTTTPPVPGLTSLSTSNTHKQNNLITSSNNRLFQLYTASNIPQLKPKLTKSNRSSPHEIITISDSPMGKNPPPLLSSITTSAGRAATANGSIHMPTISSAPLRSVLPHTSNGSDRKNYNQAIDSSRRYREYVLKQSHVRKNFQKQIERKMAVSPYPKTFRQVWPLIPVHDSGFVRNFGLEAVMHHFDPNSKAQLDKNSSKMKPICNQCCCDFASAWQIRKSNSKQLLLCEACDFQNLKILQRSKLSNQLKELMETIKTEQDKFVVECEAAQKHILELEKQAADSPPPLTSQLVGLVSTSNSATSSPTPNQRVVQVGKGVLSKYQVIPNSSSNAGKHIHVMQTSHTTSNGGLIQQKRPAIPSLLGQKSPQLVSAVGKVEVGSKRPAGRMCPAVTPASKVCKPGSALDHTLNRLSKQLIERKLDEVVVVSVKDEASEAENNSVTKEGASPTSPVPAGQKTKNRRKGTPKHKRLLSASSINSE